MDNFGGNAGLCGCLNRMDVPGYQIEGPIGFGADGATWLGRDSHGAAVAVRMLSAVPPERHRLRMGRLERVATVRNPHLAQLREVVQVGDQVAVVSEAVPGPTLATIRVERGGLSVPEAVGVGAELATALRDLHGAAVVHGDISPANVVLSPGRGAVLVDLAGEPAWESGTGGFAAPEVAAGAVPTAAADVYALAQLVVWVVADSNRDEVRRMLAAALAGETRRRCSAAELHRILSAGPGQEVRTPGAPTMAGASLREHAQREVTRRKRDHRPRHRRAPNRRPLLVMLAVLVSLAIAGVFSLPGGWSSRPDASSAQVTSSDTNTGVGTDAGTGAGTDTRTGTDTETHTDTGTGTGADTGVDSPAAGGAGDEPADPVRSAVVLTRARDTALNAGDVAALTELTVPGSPAAEHDAVLAEELSAGALAIEGLRTEVVSAELIATQQVPGLGAPRAGRQRSADAHSAGASVDHGEDHAGKARAGEGRGGRPPHSPESRTEVDHTELVRTDLRTEQHTVVTTQGSSSVGAETRCVVLEVQHHGERWRVAHVHPCS